MATGRQDLRRARHFHSGTGCEFCGATKCHHHLPTLTRLLMWHMPYAAMQSSKSRRLKIISPAAAQAATTPSDVVVDSPSSNQAITPRDQSSMSMILKRNETIDKARLLIHGRHVELDKSMNGEERKSVQPSWQLCYVQLTGLLEFILPGCISSGCFHLLQRSTGAVVLATGPRNFSDTMTTKV